MSDRELTVKVEQVRTLHTLYMELAFSDHQLPAYVMPLVLAIDDLFMVIEQDNDFTFEGDAQ